MRPRIRRVPPLTVSILAVATVGLGATGCAPLSADKGDSGFMADLLDTIRHQIDARLAELRPLAEEAVRLQAALAALESTGTVAASSRPGGSAPRRAPANGRRRPVLSRERLVEHVRAHPGSTAGDVAKALGVKRTSIATRLAQLAKSGDLVKAARGYAAP